MNQKNIYKIGVRNVIYSLFSQGITFILSIVTGFVLPKIMDISQYGYWQVYLFYTGYIMIFCFGYNDGLYLKYGNLDYNELPFKKIRSSMKLFMSIISILTIILIMLSFLENDSNKIFAFVATSINLIILGINGTLSTILQFTNRIKLNSILTIANKAIFVVLIFIALIFNEIDFKIIIIMDIISKLVILIINIYKSKEIFLGKANNMKQGFIELIDDMKIGTKLMLANIAGSLLIGIGKFIVERYMPIQEYGQYSFATTITTFALTFIAASSLSLYPFLKRINKEKLSNYYVNLNKLLCFILFLMLLGYYPIYFLIKYQFTNYIGILKYFYLLFVIIISQGKMQFLINTYYKVLREEKAMLIANLSGILVAISIIIPWFYFTRSIFSIVIGTTITLIWRCYASEIYIKRRMGINDYKNIISEILIILIFIISVRFKIIGIILYAISVLSYGYVNKNIIFKYTKKIIRLII